MVHFDWGVVHFEWGVVQFEWGVVQFEWGVVHFEWGVVHFEWGVVQFEWGVVQLGSEECASSICWRCRMYVTCVPKYRQLSVHEWMGTSKRTYAHVVQFCVQCSPACCESSPASCDPRSYVSADGRKGKRCPFPLSTLTHERGSSWLDYVQCCPL